MEPSPVIWNSLAFGSGGGGGGGNSFTTIQPDLGTAPVATSATDTLTLTSTVLSVTGTAASDTITFGVLANAITDAMLRQSGALSVIGRSANSTGNVADISAGTDNFVLRRSGTSLAFGLLVNANIDAAAAIAYSKLNLATSILNADISASAAIAFSKLATLTSGNILVGSAGNVATSVAMSGDVAIIASGATTIQNGVVTYAKMQTFGANTIIANNTGSAAAPSEKTYKENAKATYSGSITWTGTTPPSGATTHEFTWFQIDNTVFLTISLKYATPGTSLQGVAMELPAGLPSPVELSGNTAGSDRLFPGSGWIETTASAAAGAARCYMRRNSGDTAYEMFIQAGSGNHAFAMGTVPYRIA